MHTYTVCDGEWQLYLLNDIYSPYKSITSSHIFTVSGGECYGPSCDNASSPISTLTHATPSDNMIVNNIAFSSCYKPSNQNSYTLWNHVRYDFKADIWSWLGDNAYSDGNDMEYKRMKYNEGKENVYYAAAG